VWAHIRKVLPKPCGLCAVFAGGEYDFVVKVDILIATDF
jgi:hypothetical protein